MLRDRQRIEWMTERMDVAQLAPHAAVIARLVDEAPAEEWDRAGGAAAAGQARAGGAAAVHAPLALRREHDADSDVANAAADVVARLRAASLLDASKSMADLVTTKVGSHALKQRAIEARQRKGAAAGGDGPTGWDGTGEAPPLVIDVGSCYLRAGLARPLVGNRGGGGSSGVGGRAARHMRPPVTMPCVVGRPDAARLARGMSPEYVGDEALKKGELLELSLPVQHGIAVDISALYTCWAAAFVELHVQPKDHKLLVLDAPNNPKHAREAIVEMCFEVCGAPAVYVATAPTVALSAVGRRSGLVVDIGEGKVVVCPVYEGYMMPHAVRRSDAMAGRDQTLALAKFLTDGAGVQPASTLLHEAKLAPSRKRSCARRPRKRSSGGRGGARRHARRE